jgi:hypothetical protein
MGVMTDIPPRLETRFAQRRIALGARFVPEMQQGKSPWDFQYSTLCTRQPWSVSNNLNARTPVAWENWQSRWPVPTG